MALDRHVISPARSPVRDQERKERPQVVRQPRGSIGIDDSMDSKDFFEPDEISMMSAPHEIGSSIMPDLDRDAETSNKARRTA